MPDMHNNGTPFPGPGPTPTGHQPSQMSTQDSDFNAASTSTPSNGEGLGWTQVGCKQKVSTQKESAETASNLSAHEGRTRSQNSPSPEQYRSTPGIRMALDTELSVPATTLQ
ncbi:hypothetical protein PSTG_18383 [Puccinia striiformis f. sp. tritici PST-78]|uniref:Uncharacterized protein n=1 Tax=Puccinia striiformis f. sp. tritici PST-78 TaxID=1165861 RepID=A0A0L0UMB9_9BASI|nr:hypothetical protein PSTG_18383 [Puccinia striiformis f. sp. tritici PST-78]